jgi:hypothetical protein
VTVRHTPNLYTIKWHNLNKNFIKLQNKKPTLGGFFI